MFIEICPLGVGSTHTILILSSIIDDKAILVHL